MQGKGELQFPPDYQGKESVGNHSFHLILRGKRVCGTTAYFKGKESVGGHSLPLTISGRRVLGVTVYP